MKDNQVVTIFSAASARASGVTSEEFGWQGTDPHGGFLLVRSGCSHPEAV